MYRILDEWSKEHPLRVRFLNKVRGIGPVLSSGIIAWLASERLFTVRKVVELDGGAVKVRRKDRVEEIELPPGARIVEYNRKEGYIRVWAPEVMRAAEKVSQLFKYAGLVPGQRRVAGRKADHNPRVKNLMWKVWSSFIKQRGFGRKLIDAYLAKFKAEHPDWPLAKCRAYTFKPVARLFLAAVWEFWRTMEGLPVTEPYPISVLGHADKIGPKHWMEK